MPWPFNTDANGRSPERERAIAECRRCWSYESPWPDFDSIDMEEAKKADIYSGLRINYDEFQSELASLVLKHIPDWKPLSIDDGRHFCKSPQFNVSYPEYDAFILFCMVRHFRPKRIIELGSGMSTRVMVDALQSSDARSVITCVDKYASAKTKGELASIGVNFLDEDITKTSLATYEQLDRGDILFIDSSHVLKNFGDVEFEFMTVLPRLKPGVVVHVHDIFLPYNYPLNWLLEWKCVLTEQQVLGAYLHDNSRVKILAANYHNLIKGVCVPEAIEYKVGGSLWFQVQ